MSRVRRTPTVPAALLCLVSLLAAGCSDESAEAQDATPQALAAAVLAHHGEDPVAVAPIFGDERLRRDDLAVELAFDRAEGDNDHVRVVLSDGLPHDGDEEDPCDGPRRCLDVSRDGVDGTLLYEAGYPEEDPGVVVAWSVRADDEVVWAYAYGPFVARDDEGGPGEEAEALGETLAAVVTDPGVGWRTSGAYAEAGQEICEGGDWLRWYGDGNGSPEPQDYRDWCG